MTISDAGVLNPRFVLIRPRRRPYANSSLGFTGSMRWKQHVRRSVLLQFVPYRLSEVQLAPPITKLTVPREFLAWSGEVPVGSTAVGNAGATLQRRPPLKV